MLADKAHDSNALRMIIAGMNTDAAILSNHTRKIPIPRGATADKQHNRIERGFNRFKHVRRFAAPSTSSASHGAA